MGQKYTNRGSWLYAAVRGIRFEPDRKAVEAELREHIEDKVADLQRIFPDMTLWEAEERALAEMGDAEEIGAELARIHKPWWGYLWRVTRVMAWAVGIWMALMWVIWPVWEDMPWRSDGAGWQNWYENTFGQTRWEYQDECLLTGKDPFDESSPWYDPEIAATRADWRPLYVSDKDYSARAGGYRFTVDRYALWAWEDEETPGKDGWLFAELKVTGLPWEPFYAEASWYISATDSLGNYYYNSYETYDLRMERDENEGYVMINGKDNGLFTRTFALECPDGPTEDAQWLRLHFDRGGESWSITIPLKEVAS